MNNYMSIIIIRPDINEIQLTATQSNIIRLFEDRTKVDKIWYLGNKKLDYRINKYDTGIYVKLSIKAREKTINKLQQRLKEYQDVLFSVIVKNEETQKNVLKLYKNVFTIKKVHKEDEMNTNPYGKKVCMLISKNKKLPFSESDIIAVSENERNLWPIACKKIQDLIIVKGYHTIKPFKLIKEVETEFRKNKQAEFILDNNPNLRMELVLQEKYLV